MADAPWVVIVLCTTAAAELGVRLPFRSRQAILRETVDRVAAAVGSTSLSDRQKERILYACARQVFASSVVTVLLLLAVLAPFLMAVALSGLAGRDILEPMTSSGGIAATTVVAAGYALLRVRVGG